MCVFIFIYLYVPRNIYTTHMSTGGCQEVVLCFICMWGRGGISLYITRRGGEAMEWLVHALLGSWRKKKSSFLTISIPCVTLVFNLLHLYDYLKFSQVSCSY